MSDILNILVPPSSAASIATEAPTALALRPQIEMLVLVSPEDEQFAADVLTHVRAKHKKLDAQRLSIKTPLTAAGRAVDDLFRPGLDALLGLADLIKSKLGEVETARRLAAFRAEREATALAAQGKFSEASATLTKPTAKPTGIAFVESWAVKSFDLAAVVQAVLAGQLPLSFIRLDDSAIKIWLRTYKDSTALPETPGLVIERVTTVRGQG